MSDTERAHDPGFDFVTFENEFLQTEQGWHVHLPEDIPIVGDDMENIHRSTLWLFEDGVALGPPHAPHEEIVRVGKGRYSHWHQSLWFSSSDNSDPNTNGRSYKIAWLRSTATRPIGGQVRSLPILDALGDLIRARGIDRIAYFHTDHFEPFSAIEPRERWVRGLQRFAKLTRETPFANRMSLFYTPLIVPLLRNRTGIINDIRRRRNNGDYNGLMKSLSRFMVGQTPFRDRREIIFQHHQPWHLDLCIENIRPLETEGEHEFHVHLHHEGWTSSNFVFPDLEDFVSNEKDTESLDRYLYTGLALMEAELGRSVHRWGFIHGNWALNGSNADYCRIKDEMAVLRRHGCFGDFTFPAGDGHNDPLIKAPFTCATPSLTKAYDHPEADPRALSRGARDLDGRFLIWSSEIDATRSSLDLYEPCFLALLKQPEYILRDWLAKGAVLDGCLYVKTHAHSADGFYKLWEDDSIVPHAFADVQSLFKLLQRVADRAHVDVSIMTVNEVIDALTTFDKAQTLRSPALRADAACN